mgnify:FL=1
MLKVSSIVFVLRDWAMALSEKDKIFRDVWQCAFHRRYLAKLKGDWDLYQREHETIMMCLKIAKWVTYDTDKKKTSGIY